MEEAKEKKELLIKQLVQQEMEISHMKSEMVCTNKRRAEMCLDTKTREKFNKNSTIFDEILSN